MGCRYGGGRDNRWREVVEVSHVLLTAVGSDRPGIVAALAGSLVDQGCNLEDSTMTILRGQFAVLLVVDTPDGTGPGDVEAALAPVARSLDLVVAVRPIEEQVDPVGDGPAGGDGGAGGGTVTFSVHGADRPGIVHRAAQALADAGGNVIDLSTRLVGSGEAPVYVLILTVGFPPEVDRDAAAAEVRATLEAFGVHCQSHDADADVL